MQVYRVVLSLSEGDNVNYIRQLVMRSHVDNYRGLPIEFIPTAVDASASSLLSVESIVRQICDVSERQRNSRSPLFSEDLSIRPCFKPRVLAKENADGEGYRCITTEELSEFDAELVKPIDDEPSSSIGIYCDIEKLGVISGSGAYKLHDVVAYSKGTFDACHYMALLKHGVMTKDYLESFGQGSECDKMLIALTEEKFELKQGSDSLSFSLLSWALYYGDLEAAEYFLKNGQVIEGEVGDLIEGRVQSFGISGGRVSSLELLQWCDKNNLMNPSVITSDLLKSLIPINLDAFSVNTGNTYDDRFKGWEWLIDKYGKSFYTGKCHPALEVLSLYNTIEPGFRREELSVFVNKVLIDLNKKQPVTFSSFLRSPTFAADNHGNWAKSLVISPEVASENVSPKYFSNYKWYCEALQVFVQSGIEDLGPELTWANNVYTRLSKNFYEQFMITLLCLRRFLNKDSEMVINISHIELDIAFRALELNSICPYKAPYKPPFKCSALMAKQGI